MVCSPGKRLLYCYIFFWEVTVTWKKTTSNADIVQDFIIQDKTQTRACAHTQSIHIAENGSAAENHDRLFCCVLYFKLFLAQLKALATGCC